MDRDFKLNGALRSSLSKIQTAGISRGSQTGGLSNLSRETLAPHRETKLPVVTKVSELLNDVLAMFLRRLKSVKIDVR
jgi:hypothetical protein